MTQRGEIVPEVAEMLLAIAARMKTGSHTERDIEAIISLASQMSGKHTEYVFTVHRTKSNRPRHGAAGVERRYQIAKAISDFRDEHKCTLPEAYEALASNYYLGPDSLEKIWKEMNGILKMDEPNRSVMLFFKKNEARGAVKITRLRGKKET